MLTIVMIISIVIIFGIILLSALTTSKAYSYKHTIDPIENNPNIKTEETEGPKRSDS